jgi:cytochrome c oxidase subunit 4
MSANDHHDDHGPLFTKVMWALMALTAVTVGLSFVHFPGGKPMNIFVGLVVAAVKASLVVMIFMHLKWEKKWWLGMVIFPIALVCIIIFSNLPDTGMSSEHLLPAVKQLGGGGGGKH